MRVQCTQSISRFLVSLVLACCVPFTAALASVMAKGDSSDDRGPAGSDKTRGATWKYDSRDIKLGYTDGERRGFEYQLKQLIDDHQELLVLLGSHV